MKVVLEKHIRERINTTDADLTHVLSHFTTLRVKRNQVLVGQGDVCHWCYFVVEGCVQALTNDADGNESTRDIVVENNWITELASFSSQLPARETLRMIEPGQLLGIRFDDFQHLVQTVRPFGQVYRQIVEQSYIDSAARLNTFVGMDALQRIGWLLKNRPELPPRLPGKLLASYLGISPETYSRLKTVC